MRYRNRPPAKRGSIGRRAPAKVSGSSPATGPVTPASSISALIFVAMRSFANAAGPDRSAPPSWTTLVATPATANAAHTAFIRPDRNAGQRSIASPRHRNNGGSAGIQYWRKLGLGK